MNQKQEGAVTDTNNAQHYQWGVASEGWHLLNREDLSVIEELVPPGDEEVRHFHSNSRQYFYILGGEVVIERDADIFTLHPGQGIEIAPGVEHQLRNESSQPAKFLVVSCPHSHGDRTVVE